MEKDNKDKSKSKKSILSRIIIGLAALIALSIIVFVCYVLHLLSLPDKDLHGTAPSFNPLETSTEEEDTSGFENMPTITAPSTSEGDTIDETTVPHKDVEGVYNIILLGADKKSGYLTDSMIVVTINQNDNSIKMTSFMRDTWMNIPGKSPNRLNTVYQKGGKNLLFQVFRESFGIELHGYVLVDYSSLADVVDALGGVDIYVSAKIAEFLNNSNYIEGEENRTLIPGATQTLNGAQVVGYCRQRMIGNGVESNDFARTQRQRAVLNAIYEKFRNKSLVELLGVMEKVLPLVLTDMSSGEMVDIATKAITAGLGDIEQMRIPIAGTYADVVYKENEDDLGKRVMQIDFEANAIALHEFLFGKDKTSK